jgi:hypothetical protein
MRIHVIFHRLTLLLFLILLPVILLLVACGEQSGGSPEDESPKRQASMDVDWGREVNLDEMIAMAKKGEIVEIQWHIMPNILRAETNDGRIFHLRNENKGVDLRNTLINAGVKVGEGGVLFRHLF